MLRIVQIQLVAEKLTGRESVIVRPRDLDEPWRTIHHRVHCIDDLSMAERELWKATEGLPDRNELVEAVLGVLPDPDDGPRYTSLADLASTLPPIEWLWTGWLPRGMLSLLGAAPGAGKSMVALDLARRIIHGAPWPDGTPVAHPGANVLFVDAEGIPQLQEQRARHWNMDASRLYLMLPPDTYGGVLDLGDGEQQDTLVRMAHDLRPDLVIVDSLSSITLKGENSVEDVRVLLRFLADLAREFDLALLLIHHLRKRLARNRPGLTPSLEPIAADELRGSGHIIAMARSILLLSPAQAGAQPERNGPRRLEIAKSNLCAPPPPLGLRFEQPPGETPATPILRYFTPPPRREAATQLDACATWLWAHLAAAGQPLAPKDIVRAAAQAGFGRSTIYRARTLLGTCLVESGGLGPASPRTWALAPLEKENTGARP